MMSLSPRSFVPAIVMVLVNEAGIFMKLQLIEASGLSQVSATTWGSGLLACRGDVVSPHEKSTMNSRARHSGLIIVVILRTGFSQFVCTRPILQIVFLNVIKLAGIPIGYQYSSTGFAECLDSIFAN